MIFSYSGRAASGLEDPYSVCADGSAAGEVELLATGGLGSDTDFVTEC